MSNPSVVVKLDSLNFPLSYACQDLLDKQNYVSIIEVTYLYDLAYPTALDGQVSRVEIESNVLKQLAILYRLGDGSACEEPPTEGLWVLQASTNPQYDAQSLSEACLELAPSKKETCVSLAGSLLVTVVGPEDPNEIIKHISEKMLDGAVSQGTDMRVFFLGTHVDVSAYGGNQGSLAPAVSVQTQVSESRSEGMTPIGISGALCLCMAFIGLMVTLAVRRRRVVLRREMDAMTAEGDEEQPNCRPKTKAQLYMDEVINTGGETVCADNSEYFGEDPPSPHSADMGTLMTNDMLQRHGTTQVAASPARRFGNDGSEISESDADSWAQADATLCSLEVRTSPNRSTSEI